MGDYREPTASSDAQEPEQETGDLDRDFMDEELHNLKVGAEDEAGEDSYSEVQSPVSPKKGVDGEVAVDSVYGTQPRPKNTKLKSLPHNQNSEVTTTTQLSTTTTTTTTTMTTTTTTPIKADTQEKVAKHQVTGNLARLQRALSKMMQMPEAYPFNQPVDPISLKIPDYFDVVKDPMDFSTILTNVKNGLITTPEDFANDMRLVFSNAMMYNPVGHPVHMLAKTLLARFDKDYERIMLPSTPRTTRTAGSHSPSTSMSVAVHHRRPSNYSDNEVDDGDGDVKDEDYREHETRKRPSHSSRKHTSTRHSSHKSNTPSTSQSHHHSTSHSPQAPVSSAHLPHSPQQPSQPSAQNTTVDVDPTSSPPTSPGASKPNDSPQSHSDSQSSKVEMVNTLQELRKAMRTLKSELRSLKSQRNTHPPSHSNSGSSHGNPGGNTEVQHKPQPRRPTRPHIVTRTMTLQEKQQLGENIKNLPAEKLGHIVSIIQERGSVKQQQPNTPEYEIDLETLDNGTLRALERYVLSVTPNAPTDTSHPDVPRKRSPPPTVPQTDEGKLARAQQAATDTRQQILDVDRELGELDEMMGTRRKPPPKRPRVDTLSKSCSSVPTATTPPSLPQPSTPPPAQSSSTSLNPGGATSSTPTASPSQLPYLGSAEQPAESNTNHTGTEEPLPNYPPVEGTISAEIPGVSSTPTAPTNATQPTSLEPGSDSSSESSDSSSFSDSDDENAAAAGTLETLANASHHAQNATGIPPQATPNALHE
ncbi:transcription factor GTE12 [Pelomyxa schiedti]|nr:transcription factor GTE12 [Pelomyxa schiedti]